MAQKISQMTEQTTANMTEAGTSDFLGGYTATGGNANRKFSLSGLANYFLNKFKMTLGGSSQTVKSAIDALNSKMTAVILGNSDLNNLSTSAIFTVFLQNVASKATAERHYPANTAGFLLQFTCEDWTGQLYIPYNINHLYFRAWYTTIGTIPDWLQV